MRKHGFSGEILCLFLIITVAVFFGKILLDIKGVLYDAGVEPGAHHVEVDYRVYSYQYGGNISNIKDLNIIHNYEQLLSFQNMSCK